LRAKEPALYQKRRADSEVGPYNKLLALAAAARCFLMLNFSAESSSPVSSSDRQERKN